LRRIPDMVIRLVSIYSRVLSILVDKGVDIISSDELGKLSGCPGTQVRKDLAYFGQFGTRGVGYNISDLKSKVTKILGMSERWKVALVGVGNLGSAFIAHEGFRRYGFDIIISFDTDKNKVGKIYNNVEIKDVSELKQVISEMNIKIVIITVPAQFAQKVADLLVDAGIKAILNFAPITISVPKNVILRNVDLSLELEALSFFLTHKELQDNELSMLYI
jgi:redox-sensing transcriptional repressor